MSFRRNVRLRFAAERIFQSDGFTEFLDFIFRITKISDDIISKSKKHLTFLDQTIEITMGLCYTDI